MTMIAISYYKPYFVNLNISDLVMMFRIDSALPLPELDQNVLCAKF